MDPIRGGQRWAMRSRKSANVGDSAPREKVAGSGKRGGWQVVGTWEKRIRRTGGRRREGSRTVGRSCGCGEGTRAGKWTGRTIHN